MDAALPTCPDNSLPRGVLVVDDHELLRLGLRTLIQSHTASTGHAVPVFEARSLGDALALYAAQHSRIALVLLDLHLPDAHGLSGLVAFVGQFPTARVVVLSGVGDLALQREALAQGAQAYLAKSGDLQQVVHYIRSLGMLQHDPQPQGTRPQGAQPGTRLVQTGLGEPLQLSARQAQILDWMLAGLSNQEIAAQAHLSEGTVKNHVSTLLLLFGVRSRAQLISQLR